MSQIQHSIFEDHQVFKNSHKLSKGKNESLRLATHPLLSLI